MSNAKVLYEKAYQAMKRAYAPYSHFHVGAALQSTEGTIFIGCNVENISYGLTVCAEASAVVQMIAHGHRKIASMLVLSDGEKICYPCGACRQVLREFSDADTLIYLSQEEGKIQTYTMEDLLPLSFDQQCME